MIDLQKMGQKKRLGGGECRRGRKRNRMKSGTCLREITEMAMKMHPSPGS